MEDHPGNAKLVSGLAKAKREKSFFHRHEGLAAAGENLIDSFRLFNAARKEGEVGATQGLGVGDIRFWPWVIIITIFPPRCCS
jgi:hypothetical protein